MSRTTSQIPFFLYNNCLSEPFELESFFMSAISQLPYLSRAEGPVKLSHDINLRSSLHMRKLDFRAKWLFLIINKKYNYCFKLQEKYQLYG